MTRRRTVRTAAALVAVAGMLAGCSSKVSGSAEPLAPAPSTGSASEKAAVSEPGPVGPLQNVTGQKGTLLRSLGGSGPFWAPSPTPGINVSTQVAGCTLGPAIKQGARTGFVIADHCRKGGIPQLAMVQPDAATLPIGVAEQVADVPDAAVIWTDTAADDTKVAGIWPVRGVLSEARVKALPAATWICVNGAISGVHCGGKTSAGVGQLRFATPVKEGDSGSEVFVVDSRGDAWLAGLLSKGIGSSVATILAPVLERLGAQPVTA